MADQTALGQPAGVAETEPRWSEDHRDAVSASTGPPAMPSPGLPRPTSELQPPEAGLAARAAKEAAQLVHSARRVGTDGSRPPSHTICAASRPPPPPSGPVSACSMWAPSRRVGSATMISWPSPDPTDHGVGPETGRDGAAEASKSPRRHLGRRGSGSDPLSSGSDQIKGFGKPLQRLSARLAPDPLFWPFRSHFLIISGIFGARFRLERTKHQPNRSIRID